MSKSSTVNAQTLFWHLFSGEKVATLSRSLVRFCRFLLEKDTEMNEKRRKVQVMLKIKTSSKFTNANEPKIPEKDTEMNQKRNKIQNYDESRKFPQK